MAYLIKKQCQFGKYRQTSRANLRSTTATVVLGASCKNSVKLDLVAISKHIKNIGGIYDYLIIGYVNVNK